MACWLVLSEEAQTRQSCGACLSTPVARLWYEVLLRCHGEGDGVCA